MGRALGAVDHHDLGRDPARPAMVRPLWRCLRVSGADRPDRALAGVGAGRPAEDELFTLRFLVDARHRHLDHAARDGRLSAWAELSARSEEHTSELQSLMRISYAVFCL